MREYDDAHFNDDGAIRWIPYIMHFHPASYRSPVVNTDSLGFRFTTCNGQSIAVDGYEPHESVSILVGSSTIFGVGASSDAATMASCLNTRSPSKSAPWINMGGRLHNSAQELVLHVLVRHRLAKVDRIVLFSGFNDLALARLPAALRYEGGGFFLCDGFFKRLEGTRRRLYRRLHRTRSGAGKTMVDGDLLDIDQQLHYAAGLVLRHLDVWRSLADDAGAELTYVLQPLASWVRDRGTDEEAALFSYLDKRAGFSEMYGDIARCDVGAAYAHLLREGCAGMGIRFADMTPLIGAAIEPTDWIFVDRIHLTDLGYNLTARLLLDEVLC
jgi:hypothetical protein